jgi:hypothetical protein
MYGAVLIHSAAGDHQIGFARAIASAQRIAFSPEATLLTVGIRLFGHGVDTGPTGAVLYAPCTLP